MSGTAKCSLMIQMMRSHQTYARDTLLCKYRTILNKYDSIATDEVLNANV